MGWLAGYSYRMSIPVANPSVQGNRALDAIPFPAWFLRHMGKITEDTYASVHVTTNDGVTELPCTLSSDKKSIYIDYPAMPVGRTMLFVYYGKLGASAPTGVAYYTKARVDAGVL